MKRYKSMAKTLLVTLLAVMASGCKWAGTYDVQPYAHLFHEEEVHLTEDASSPFCDLSIDYSFLDEKDDSTATLINRAIQREFLGEEYATLPPETAVDSFKNVHIRNYRQDTGELYRADLARHGAEAELPAWYNQTYSLVTFVEEGRPGTLNVTANWFEDTGGAHPHQWSRWLNFDSATGRPLTRQDVFHPTAQADIEHLLLDKLLVHVGEQYPDETLASTDDLQQKGYLQLTNMYIPDNFLLSKKGVLFLFNRYDIAPYSAGEIVLEVPYGEIGQWIKQ